MKSQKESWTRVLEWAFIAYAAAVLTSQAGMSLGAAFLGVCAILALTDRRAQFPPLWSEFPRFRLYLELSVAFFMCFVVSDVGAALFPLTYNGVRAHGFELSSLGKSWYLFWPILLVWVGSRISESSKRKAYLLWILASGVLGLIGIQQHFTGWPRPQRIPYIETRFHASLFFGHHLSVASILIFPFFAALDFSGKWLFSSKPQKALGPLALRVAVLVSVFSIAATLILTFSRTLWVALPIGVFVWILLTFPRKWAAPLLGVTFALLIGLSQVPDLRTRFVNSMGTVQREKLWDANWEFFKQRPLTGVGWLQNEELAGHYLAEKYPDKRIFSGRAHNMPLEVVGSLGLLGLFVWGAWVSWIAVRFWRLGRASVAGELPPWAKSLGAGWGLLCAWIVFQLNGLTQVNLWEGKVLHQVMWCVSWAILMTALRPSSKS